MASNEPASKAKGHRGRWMALIIVLLLIGGGYYVYATYLSLPSALVSAFTSGQQLNSALLQNILLAKVNASKTFAVNYTGQIIIHKDPPLSISYSKYYNTTKVTLAITNLAPFGNTTITYAANANGKGGVLCVKASPGSVFASINSSNVTNGYKCLPTASTGGSSQFYRIINNFINVSSLGNVVTKGYGAKLYNSKPCYSVSGTGTIRVNNTLIDVKAPGQTPVGLAFSACLSARYNIPLQLSANLTAPNHSYILINLNETSLSQTS